VEYYPISDPSLQNPIPVSGSVAIDLTAKTVSGILEGTIQIVDEREIVFTKETQTFIEGRWVALWQSGDLDRVTGRRAHNRR